MVTAIGQPVLKIQSFARIRFAAAGIKKIHHRAPLEFPNGIREQGRTFSNVPGEQVKVWDLRRRFSFPAAKWDNAGAAEREHPAGQSIVDF